MDSTVSSGAATPGPLAQRAPDHLDVHDASIADGRRARRRVDDVSMSSTTAPFSSAVDFVNMAERGSRLLTGLIVTAIISLAVFAVYRGYQMVGSYLGMH